MVSLLATDHCCMCSNSISMSQFVCWGASNVVLSAYLLSEDFLDEVFNFWAFMMYNICPMADAWSLDNTPSNWQSRLCKYSRRQQVTCFQLYPSRLSRPQSCCYSNAKETKLVIGWKLLSLGRPNPKISRLLGKWCHAFFENTSMRHWLSAPR